MGNNPSSRDFFISYASPNRDWAEWVSVQLEQAGFSTLYQAADFRPGRDFVHEMHKALSSAKRIIALLSPAYLASDFGEAEWRAVFVQDPTGEQGLLIPARIQRCDPPGLLASRIYVDFVNVDEVGARKKLLAAVDSVRPRRVAAKFPGNLSEHDEVQFPGAGLTVANLPARNRLFTGRDDVLRAIHDGLQEGGSATAVVSGAVHGLGGVGKTAVAVEYAHRFRNDYDIVWWIDAEQPATVATQLAKLGRMLKLPATSDEQDAVAAVFDHLNCRGRWLLVYDNAERPESLVGLRPTGGGGHVLVTSRWPDWRGHASTVGVEVWLRFESVAFLRARTRHSDERLLGELADLVGDLPLAVEEAAAYLEQTGEDLAAYVGLVNKRARELFAAPGAREGDADRRRVAAVWTLSLEQVHRRQPLAEKLLSLLAFLAPQVPRWLPSEQPQALSHDLCAAVSDRLSYNMLLETAGRYSLVTLGPREIGMHRLVQAVVQARLNRRDEISWVTTAVTLIRGVYPIHSWEPQSWPSCQQLLVHVLAVTEHAERLSICGEQAGWLLDRASAYLRERGDYRRAEPLARRALSLTQATLGADHAETAGRHDVLGRALRALGRLDEARTQYETALAISLAALGTNHPDIGARRSGLGSVLKDLGRLDEARDQYEQALTIGLSTLEPDHPEIGIRRNNLGRALRDLGHLEEAQGQLQQALTISLTALGPDHPTIGTWRNNLGLVLHDLGRLEEARTELKQALSIDLATHGPDHPDIGTRRNNLGRVLRDLGQFDEARAELEQALTISLAALGPDHPTIAIRRGNLGRVLRDLGQLEEARTELEQALTIGVAALGPDHPTTGIWRDNLGRLLQDLGQLGEARTQLQQALTISLTALGPDHPQTRTIRDHLNELTLSPGRRQSNTDKESND
ncbi:FxSxx-COOH system tetratricopeptide repeat protein [Micromonospora arborensis]|uniref:FxSxx-COOH system tetratricopeptide repeat protein n=1 Tax=Micromonospora arborensis TaxID=2116518 RepID=UPI003723F38D